MNSFDSNAEVHSTLNQFNCERLAPRLTAESPQRRIIEALPCVQLELEFVENERRVVSEWARSAPTDAESFVSWFNALAEGGPGQNDPLFVWLEHVANRGEMKWFLTQEVAGEAGFDDLVALTQLQLPTEAKLEMARNYWDEMGQGHAGGMHGPMLASLAAKLQLPVATMPIVWQAKALGNLLVALAIHRDYAYQSIGALGVIELTAPQRAGCVNAGLKRLGVDGQTRRYYAIHASLDVKHAEAWTKNVLRPLIQNNPLVAPLIAEGALMRLNAGARCFAAYRAHFGGAAGFEKSLQRARAVDEHLT